MFYHWEVSPGPLSRCPGCVVTCECQVTSGLAPGRDGDAPQPLLHLQLHLAPAGLHLAPEGFKDPLRCSLV